MGFYGANPQEACEACEAWLREQPEPEVRDLSIFQRMLADTIDFGNEKGIETAPLVVVSQALTENLLTHSVRS